MVDNCFSCWRLASNVSLLSPPSGYFDEPRRSQRRRTGEALISTSVGDIHKTNRNSLRNTRKNNINDAGLKATSKRCRRRSCDVIRTSGFRRRRMSSPATLLAATFSGGMLFGRPLDDICQPDLPRPVIQMLSVLYDRGPQSNGLFRRSANYAKCQSAKTTLDAGRQFNFDEVPLAVTAALLKEFLRCLPDCLLTSALYQQWLDVANISSQSACNKQFKRLVESLPVSHQLLLRYLMLILRRVGDNWSSNEMTSHNVAACIGQCLLWPASHVRMSADGHLVAAKQLNQVVEKMINGARDIFGSDPLPFSLKSEFSSKTKSECGSDSDQQCSDHSSPAASSTSESSAIDSSSRGMNGRHGRHTLPLLRGDRKVASRPPSRSPSDLLYNRRRENQTSGIARSISSFSNDSGCSNSFGSETLLDQSDNRQRLRTADTTPNDAGLSRYDDSRNDSGYHNNTAVQPVDGDTAFVRRSNSESGILYASDQNDVQRENDEVHGADLAQSNMHAASDSAASVPEVSSPLNVVQRRACSSAKCQQNCARDGDSHGKVLTRKLRRASMLTRPQQQDAITKTRRRHSFMLPNGSDIYPTRFSTGFAWPTIVEEPVHLTDGESDDMGTKQFRKKRGDAVFSADEDSTFADLQAFRATLKSAQQSANVDASKSDAAPTSKESGFTIYDSDLSVDRRELGAKFRSGKQLADAESGRVNSGLIDCGATVSDVFEEGTFADFKAIEIELGRTTAPPAVSPSPSPTMIRRPPSYDEALLHKALRGDLAESERLMTYQDARSPAGRRPDTTHLLTSSTHGDVVVATKIGTEESEAGCRRPPPPYQLRPRRQNFGEDEIHKTFNNKPDGSEPIQRTSIHEKITGKDSSQNEGGQPRTNKSEPAVARVNEIDGNSPDLQRSSSFPPQRRRHTTNSAQKENVASHSVDSTSAVTSKSAAAPSPRSPAASVDATRKSSRNSVLLQRRSLTMRDRDWHRELVDQYSIGASPRSVRISTTAYV